MKVVLILLSLFVTYTIFQGIYFNMKKESMMMTVKSSKAKVFKNVALMTGVLLAAFLFAVVNPTYAAAAATTAAGASDWAKTIGAGIAAGGAFLGAGIAVALNGSAALGAVSEDPKMLGKSLIFVGLAEGVAIYGFVIYFLMTA